MSSTTIDPAAELHACLDRAGAVDLDRLGADGQAALLRSITRAEARVVAWKLQVIAAADRSRAAR